VSDCPSKRVAEREGVKFYPNQPSLSHSNNHTYRQTHKQRERKGGGAHTRKRGTVPEDLGFLGLEENKRIGW